MSITDELRKWLKSLYTPNSGAVKDEGERIADRIDAEHERAVMSAMNDALYHANEEDMAELGWIRLPVDADGVSIRVGDVMEWADGMTFEVVGIGDGTLFYVESDDADHAEWTDASTKRHHHASTVEDVLTEFGIDWEHESDCEDRAALLKEYAAKLRLAEGEDA